VGDGASLPYLDPLLLCLHSYVPRIWPIWPAVPSVPAFRRQIRSCLEWHQDCRRRRRRTLAPNLDSVRATADHHVDKIGGAEERTAMGSDQLAAVGSRTSPIGPVARVVGSTACTCVLVHDSWPLRPSSRQCLGSLSSLSGLIRSRQASCQASVAYVGTIFRRVVLPSRPGLLGLVLQFCLLDREPGNPPIRLAPPLMGDRPPTGSAYSVTGRRMGYYTTHIVLSTHARPASLAWPPGPLLQAPRATAFGRWVRSLVGDYRCRFGSMVPSQS
jgi:hypothetical protein